MGQVVLFLMVLSGGVPDWHRYESEFFDTMAECRAMGNEITYQNFHINNYICVSPSEVEAEYFPEEDTSIIQE